MCVKVMIILCTYSSYLQAFLIAVTAQFIPLLVYRYRDPAPDVRRNSPAYKNDNLQRNLGGYVEYSLSPFPIEDLVNDTNNPFPLPSAIALNFYNGTDDATDFYFQPYHTNVSCFMDEDMWGNNTAKLVDFACVENCGIPNVTGTILPYFRESAWDRFTDRNNIDNARDRRYRMCLNETYECRLVICVY